MSGADIIRARPTWGLDEALLTVPGVYAANRYNFSLDQRISMRGFGARSSFGIRGIKVLIDGIPQTLPDGSGQLNNLELGAADRIEVLRGPSSTLFGNASGGVINILTDRTAPEQATQEVRALAGTFDRHDLPMWTKWQATTRFTAGRGNGMLTLSRLSYRGERQHSDADFRSLNARYTTALGSRTTLSFTAALAEDPRADNPGALTANELAANPDSAAANNLTRHAGKDVEQFQGGLTLRHALDAGDLELTVFGIFRDLANPQTFAYIALHRKAFGARFTIRQPVALLGRTATLMTGIDVQRQGDNRVNVGNQAGQPDTVRQLDQKENVTEFGPFARIEIPVDTRTALSAGLRFDRVSFGVTDHLVTATNPDDSGHRVMSSVSGSIGLTRQVGRGITAYATVGTSFETPTTTELTNRPDTAGGFNAVLGPQRAVNVEIGARGALSRRLRWSVALYRAAVRDELIAYAVVGSPGRVFYQNAGRSRHRGLEVGADAAITSWLGFTLSWTQSDFRYTSYVTSGRDLSGRPIPGIPAQWLHLLWRLHPAFARGGWAEVEQTHSSSFVVDDTLDTRNAAWTTTSVRAGWEGRIGGIRLAPFIGVNNVFDKRYVGSVVINAAAGRYYEPAPGRNGYLGLTIGVGR